MAWAAHLPAIFSFTLTSIQETEMLLKAAAPSRQSVIVHQALQIAGVFRAELLEWVTNLCCCLVQCRADRGEHCIHGMVTLNLQQI
jgi:hypothetical protein